MLTTFLESDWKIFQTFGCYSYWHPKTLFNVLHSIMINSPVNSMTFMAAQESRLCWVLGEITRNGDPGIFPGAQTRVNFRGVARTSEFWGWRGQRFLINFRIIPKPGFQFWVITTTTRSLVSSGEWTWATVSFVGAWYQTLLSLGKRLVTSAGNPFLNYWTFFMVW